MKNKTMYLMLIIGLSLVLSLGLISAQNNVVTSKIGVKINKMVNTPNVNCNYCNSDCRNGFIRPANQMCNRGIDILIRPAYLMGIRNSHYSGSESDKPLGSSSDYSSKY